MTNGNLIAALDLGSTRTCAVIAQITGDDRASGAKILGVGISRETGVRRGVVRDIDETTRSIVDAMRDAERMAGVQVPNIHCGIAGEHIQVRTSDGLASVSGEEISKADVERVNDVATAITMGPDRELLHSIPQEYRVDDQDGISDPQGMTGLRLEVHMYLVSVQTAVAQNLRKSVERAGYRVGQLVLEPLAASMAVLTEEERELGCVLVDLGGGSTGVGVFKDGKIQHVASLPYAGAHITSDIVQGLSVTQADAERLKEKWGMAYTPMVDPDETIDLPSTPGQGVRQAKRELLAHIIHQRLDEILGLAQQEIEKTGLAGNLPAGVVVTGGGAHLPGVVELAREAFALPARAGAPLHGISGLVDSVQAPRYTVAVGLLLYAAARETHARAAAESGTGKILSSVKRWLQDFF
ncbi:MAG: cell division protein FtsA [Gemmatimonadetes bacterium]|nr:cell division protein FtsA [Gemmatimonadota bacterium]